MPTIATAQTGELFKPQYTTHGAEVYEVYGGVGLYTQTAETQTVPLDTPKVTNKVFVNVLDWTKGVELSKNMFDDNMHQNLTKVKSPYFGTCAPCAFA